ncbi:hypothetical protein COV19_06105 [Candidatus Woesearchaeota archaeon CG10_big_fil_rev_8_21_14_0_10_44_13]|nr:MAG: hypothetical protein COV19_06105 [Candidatus Woesearchaeota archaeon CG10_big_fil_rev_8_21_14_0_10_44_13]
MEHLFVARHGTQGIDGKLSDEGRAQAAVLGDDINNILNGSSAYILSSSAPIAIESAKTITLRLAKREISYLVEVIPYLWTGEGAPEGSYGSAFNDCNGFLMEILNGRRENAEGIIIVSHLEVVNFFPKYFRRKEFGVTEHIETLGHGSAVHFDIRHKTYRILGYCRRNNKEKTDQKPD